MSTLLRAADRFVGGLTIEIHCRSCGEAFVPTREDLRRGPEWYRTCPECRPVDVAGEQRNERS